MPIAEIELPNGKIAEIEVPEGATEQQILEFVSNNAAQFQDSSTSQPKQESFQQANRRRATEFAKGIPQGLGNAFIGAVQTATDIGETGAKFLEKAIYKDDPLQKETFGTRLAEEVKGLKEKQSQLPLSERLGIGLGEVAPYAGIGSGMGLAKQGALAGFASGLLSPQKETGLTNRAKEGAIDAAIGAVAGKAIEKIANVPSIVKNMFSKKTDEKKVADIISKNIPKKDIEAGISELETGSENIVGLDINSPTFENMFKTSLSKFPDSKQIASEFGRGRMVEGYNRINKSLNRISLKDSGTQNIKNLKNAKIAITKPIYDLAKNNPIKIPEFQYKTIKITELPSTTRFTNQSKTSGIRKDMQTDLETTEQFVKGGKATSIYDDEKGVITEGNNFLQSQKEIGSFTSGTTKGDTITKTQSKIIQEGDKNIKIDREITNLKDLSAKDKIIAKQFDELKSSSAYDKLIKKSQQDFSLLNGVKNTKDLIILKEKYNKFYDDFSSFEEGNVLKERIDNLLREINPIVKQADEISSRFSKIIDAGEEGLKFTSTSKEEAKMYINSLNPKQLEAYQASAKEALLETVEKNVIDLGEKTVKVKSAEAIFDNLYKRENIKLLFKGNKAGYDAFKREMIDEIKFNQTLQRFGLTSADVVNDANAMANVASRALAFTAGGGKTGALFEAGRFIERLTLKKYKGLNKKSANLLAKAMINKQNSLKALKTAYEQLNKEQKVIAKQFIEDISPAIGLSITNEFTD